MYNHYGAWLRLIPCLLIGLAACRATAPAPAIQVGEQAPALALESASGEAFALDRGVTLLSFINTQADRTAATPDPSRAQIVFLKSMAQQYGAQGLNVLIVDASALTGPPASTDDLVNFAYDWSLGDDIPVLADPGSEAARAFGVAAAPTTFLLDAEGIVRQRWDAFASAPQLAQGIQQAFGLDVFGTPVAADQSCPETPALAEFPGLALARQVTDAVWVVDGGAAWAESMPLRWLVFAPANRDLTLRVVAESADGDETVLIADAPLEPLPQNESDALSPDSGLAAYSTAHAIPALPPATCLTIRAEVREGSRIIASGEITVRAAP